MIIEDEINLWSYPLSKDCKDLITNLMSKDPQKRFSIREIFEHPWIAKYKDWKTKGGKLDSDDGGICELEEEALEKEGQDESNPYVNI